MEGAALTLDQGGGHCGGGPGRQHVVGVEVHDDVAVGDRDAGVERPLLALALLEHDPDLTAPASEDLPRRVRGAIVDDDDLHLGPALVEGVGQRAGEEPRVVVVGDDDADERLPREQFGRARERQ
jgi:hypothetical protein